MIVGMQLPDWVEQPVPEYDVTPIHDAIGKFVLAFKRVEVWLANLHVQFGGEPTYIEADRRGVSALAARLNNRPRRVLGWRTPAEVYAQATAADNGIVA